jgi:pimeloyl-ACP methyl ester carboxylesterase
MTVSPIQHYCPCFTVGVGFNNLAYVQWEPADKNAPHKPLICVHGYSRNGRDFDFIARHLSQTQNFSVYCPDMLGRGNSDYLTKDHIAHYNNANFATHLVSLISRATQDKQQIDYFGTSMGGIIGMILAASPKSPIKRLILNDIGPVIKLAALKRIKYGLENSKKSYASLQEALDACKERYKTFGINSDEEWEHFSNISFQKHENEWEMRYDPQIAAAFVVPEEDIKMWSFWDLIRCPVLLIRGEKSDIIDMETVNEMRTRGPKDFTYVEIKNVGHAPMIWNDEKIQIV